MKKILCTILLLFFTYSAWGQNQTITDFEVTTDIATTEHSGVFGVYIEISISRSYFPTGVHVAEDTLIPFAKSDTFPEISIRHLGTDEKLLDIPATNLHPIWFGFWLKVDDAENKEVMEKLKSRGENQFYIWISESLPIPLTDGSLLWITPDELKEKSATRVALTENQVEELIRKRGGEISLYGSHFDFGKKVNGEDTAVTNYTLSFSINKEMGVPWNRMILFGQISTDEEDPFNKMGIYPINVNLSRAFLKKTGESRVSLQSGIEGNRNFDKARVNVNFLWQGIVPNLVDLTSGANRLRLKPVLTLGAKGLFEFKNDGGETQNRGELFSEIYYHIPVLKHYSLLLEGNFFWISDQDFNFHRKNARWNYQAALGYEVPALGLKTIAKYSFGENDVNLIKDEKLIIGFMVDLFRTTIPNE